MALYPEKFLLKLPAGTLSRLDSVTDNRSDYIRALIDRAVSPKKNSIVSDDGVLLSLISEKVRVSSREACTALGWTAGRVARAELQLINAGKIKYVSGNMEAKVT